MKLYCVYSIPAEASTCFMWPWENSVDHCNSLVCMSGILGCHSFSVLCCTRVGYSPQILDCVQLLAVIPWLHSICETELPTAELPSEELCRLDPHSTQGQPPLSRHKKFQGLWCCFYLFLRLWLSPLVFRLLFTSTFLPFPMGFCVVWSKISLCSNRWPRI